MMMNSPEVCLNIGYSKNPPWMRLLRENLTGDQTKRHKTQICIAQISNIEPTNVSLSILGCSRTISIIKAHNQSIIIYNIWFIFCILLNWLCSIAKTDQGLNDLYPGLPWISRLRMATIGIGLEQLQRVP